MKKPFLLRGSQSLFNKYRITNKEITVYLSQGREFTGRIDFWDDYAVKLILQDEEVMIPIHNILYCKFEHFLLENEKQNFYANVDRGMGYSSGREEALLNWYERKQSLLHFYMEDGVEVRGRLRWHLDYVYCIRPDGEVLDYLIHKRTILYYKKIEEEKVLVEAGDGSGPG